MHLVQEQFSREKTSEPEDGLGNPVTKNVGCTKNRRQILENRIKRIEKNNNSGKILVEVATTFHFKL